MNTILRALLTAALLGVSASTFAATIDLIEAAADGDDIIRQYLQQQFSWGGEYVDINLSNEIIANVDVFRSGYGTSVVHIPGINTSYEDALRNIKALQELLKGSPKTRQFYSGIGFTNNNGAEEASNFAKLFCANIASEYWVVDDDAMQEYCAARFIRNGIVDEYTQLWFQNLGLALRAFANDNYVDRSLVIDIALATMRTIDAGQTVVFVTFSQGNMYLRDVIDFILNQPRGDKYVQSIGVVMVGSPIREWRIPGLDVHTAFVADCRDPITKINLTLGLSIDCYRTDIPLSTETISSAESSRWTFSVHNFTEYYTKQLSLSQAIVRGVEDVADQLKPQRALFTVDERVYAIDNLNLRTSSGDLKYVVSSGSGGEVFSIGTQIIDEYYRASVCFDDSTEIRLPNGVVSTVGEQNISDQCGFVATGWLRYDLDGVEVADGLQTEPVGVADPVESALPQLLEVSEYATVQLTSDLLEYVPEQGDILQTDIDGCAECIEVIQNSAVVVSGNYDSVETPPERPNDPPVLTTLPPSEVGFTSADFEGTVDFNGNCGSLQFQFGTSPNFVGADGISADCNASGVQEVSLNVPHSCGTSVYYRLRFTDSYGVVYGNTYSFDAPECSPGDPTNLEVSHDVVANDIILTFGEPTLPTYAGVQLWRNIVSDPRPDINNIGEWQHIHTYPSGVGLIRDEYTDPQPGSEYLFEVRFDSTGQGGGLSGFSEEVGITIEGVYTPQANFPNHFGVNLQSAGIQLRATPGDGLFNIERSVNGGDFITIARQYEETEGDLEWDDLSVEYGNEYCYRFEQSGLTSEEVCVSYIDPSSSDVASILALNKLDDGNLRISFISPFGNQGYYRIWYHPGNGAWQMVGSTAYMGQTIMSADIGYDDASIACVRIEYVVVTDSIGFSDELCIESWIDEMVVDEPIEEVDPIVSVEPFNVYIDGLENGYLDWGWCGFHTISSTEQVYAGSLSFKTECVNWDGANFKRDGVDTADYEYLEFYLYPEGNTHIRVRFVSETNTQSDFVHVVDYSSELYQVNEWNFIKIPIADFNLNTSKINNILIQPAGTLDFHLDNIRFVGSGETSSDPEPPAEDPVEDPTQEFEILNSRTLIADSLGSGVANWSWCNPVVFTGSGVSPYEGSTSLRAVCEEDHGVNLHFGSLDISSYTHVGLAFHGGEESHLEYHTRFVLAGGGTTEYVDLGNYPPGGVTPDWQYILIPLSDFVNLTNNVANLMIQPKADTTFYIDKLELLELSN